VTLLDREVEPIIASSGTGEEALIKEARRLRRRRWIIGSVIAALAVGLGAAGFFLASGPPSTSHHAPTANGLRTPRPPAASARAFVPTRSPDLIEPTTLATLANGDLLILDSSRDQILELRPDGDLSVFAGNGRLGSGGDGGPARDAELDFTDFSFAEMAVTPDGTVDLLDNGACRIRAVSPDGIIRTILRVPLAKWSQGGTYCPISGFAVSPTGVPYIATTSEIERVSASGHLVWVAGAHGSAAYLTPSHVAFYPSALAFNSTGDLDIWNNSPKLIFQLAPNGRLTQLAGVSYAHQLTTGLNGTVLAGTQDGEIQEITSAGVRPFYSVVPKRVTGIHWGHDGAFQEDGIAVTKTGTIYVDNAQGNGFGAGSVLVRISPTKHAALAPIRTPLDATLPKLDAPGFPASLYPAAQGSHGTVLSSCPSDKGLQRFSPSVVAQAAQIAKTYNSGQFAADVAVTDRSWWTADFNRYASGNLGGSHVVTRETPASKSPAATGLTAACGHELVGDSIAVRVGPSASSDFAGTLYLLDRNGHPLVYYVR
jgi:hypothetical protein